MSRSVSAKAAPRAPQQRRQVSPWERPPRQYATRRSSRSSSPTRYSRRSTREVAPHLARDAALLFAHGFNVHYGRVAPPEGHDVIMVAPKGPGHVVRRLFTEGFGTPAVVAVAQDASGNALRPRTRVRHGHRRRPRGDDRDHIRGGDRDRPLRRAGRPLRRRHRAHPRGLRDAGRGRLPARGRATTSASTS